MENNQPQSHTGPLVTPMTTVLKGNFVKSESGQIIFCLSEEGETTMTVVPASAQTPVNK